MTNSGVIGPKGRAIGEPQGTPTFGSEPIYEPSTNTLRYRKGPKWIPGLALYNCQPDTFGYWRGALARARAGGAAAHLMCGPGDSTTYGSYASGNIAANSWSGRAQSMLSQAGRYGPVREAVVELAIEGTPARHTLGTGWSMGGPGNSAQAAAGAAGTLDITPTVNVDTFVVHYVQWGSGATLSAVVDSGSPTTKNTNGAAISQSWTVAAGSPGAHTLHLSSTGTGTCLVYGWEAYDSTLTPGIKVSRIGYSGATITATYPTGQGYLGMDRYLYYAPDLAIPTIGVNDALGSTSVPVFKDALRTRVKLLQAANSSVMLMAQWQPATSWNNWAQWPLYVQAQYELADDLGVPLLDLTARYNSAPGANPYGLFSDNVHPNSNGHVDWAAAVVQVLQHVS
jgi:lysophospholipase L1-like esterase